jgi:hypothetical protein
MAALAEAQESGTQDERREPAQHGIAERQSGAVRLRFVLPDPRERCEFQSEPVGPGKWRHTCKRCNSSVVTRRPNCVAKCSIPGEVQMPGYGKRYKTLKSAKARWEEAGKPVRSDERVQEIYDQHCSQCPMLTATLLGEACKLCGCKLSREGNWLNKLRWATESCPLEQPKWTADR